MTELPEIQTQPEPDYIARAGDLLEAVLAGEIDLEARFAVGAAIAVLYDVYPPYPPPGEVGAPIELASGVRLALEALASPGHRQVPVSEAIRVGLAARELHPVRDRR